MTLQQSAYLTTVDVTHVKSLSSVPALGSWSAENKENKPHQSVGHHRKLAPDQLEESVQSLIEKMQKGLEVSAPYGTYRVWR